MDAQFQSSVIFVQDIPASRQFYEGLLGQQVLMDHGPNVGYVGGFALWQAEHAYQTIFGRPCQAKRLGFAGEYTFKGFADRTSRGYVEMNETLRQTVEAGLHCLSAELRASEPFGWGLALAAHAPGMCWLPVELG